MKWELVPLVPLVLVLLWSPGGRGGQLGLTARLDPGHLQYPVEETDQSDFLKTDKNMQKVGLQQHLHFVHGHLELHQSLQHPVNK